MPAEKPKSPRTGARPSNPVRRALDATDRAILGELAINGRLPNNLLADKVGIAPSTCLMRTQALMKAGIIRGFHADIDQSLLGADVQALISVRVRGSARANLPAIGQAFAREPGVINVFFIAGAFDFMIHVASANTEGLRDFVSRTLSARPDIESTQTSLVFEHIPGKGFAF